MVTLCVHVSGLFDIFWYICICISIWYPGSTYFSSVGHSLGSIRIKSIFMWINCVNKHIAKDSSLIKSDFVTISLYHHYQYIIDFNTNCPVGWISLYSPGMDVIPHIFHSVMCFSESLCIIYYQTLGIQLLEYSIPAPPTRASQKPSKCRYLGNQEWHHPLVSKRPFF